MKNPKEPLSINIFLLSMMCLVIRTAIDLVRGIKITDWIHLPAIPGNYEC